MGRTAFGVNLGFRKNPDGSTSFAGSLRVEGGVWSANSGTRLERNINAATFGDSKANFTTVSDYENLLIPIPATETTVQTYNPTPISTLTMHNPYLRYTACGGISSQTTTQMLARSAAVSSSTRKAVVDVLAKFPDVIQFRAGINDLISLTTGDVDAIASAVYTRRAKLLRMLLSGGALVIDNGIEGVSGGVAGNLALIQQVALALNAKLRAAAAAGAFGLRWEFNDLAGVSYDPSTGAFLPGISTDGVHLNTYGGYIVGKAENAILSRYFVGGGSQSSIIYNGQADFATPTDFVPAGYAIAGTSVTGLVATECDMSGVVISGVSTSDTLSEVRLSKIEALNSIYAGMASGDKLLWRFGVLEASFPGPITATITIELRDSVLPSKRSVQGIYEATCDPVFTAQHHMNLPVNAANLSATSPVAMKIKGIPAGEFTLKFAPLMVYKP